MMAPAPRTQTPIWTTAQAQRLRALMQAKGWDEAQLAQWAALSIQQVRELCSEADCEQLGAFYSHQIKRHAGARLIEKLSPGEPG